MAEPISQLCEQAVAVMCDDEGLTCTAHVSLDPFTCQLERVPPLSLKRTSCRKLQVMRVFVCVKYPTCASPGLYPRPERVGVGVEAEIPIQGWTKGRICGVKDMGKPCPVFCRLAARLILASSSLVGGRGTSTITAPRWPEGWPRSGRLSHSWNLNRMRVKHGKGFVRFSA